MNDPIDMVFAALANPTRRELLRLLRDEGQQPVQHLANHFTMQRPSISEHLKVLRDVGLVSEQKQGRQRYYYLEGAMILSDSRVVSALRTVLERPDCQSGDITCRGEP